MSAYAAVSSLMNNIDQIMNHPRLSTSLDDNQIKSLRRKADELLDFIEGYNNGGTISKVIQDLERQIVSVAHAAEDVVESHIVRQIHDRATLRCPIDLQQITQDMGAILEKAAVVRVRVRVRVREIQRMLGEEKPKSPSASRPREIAMVGFDDVLIQLMDELTSQRSSRHVISIVGMGGMGKTTLARNLYHTSLIMEHFDIRAWATLSQEYTLNNILLQLLSGQVVPSVDEFGQKLYKMLSGRRYLIILDDIWSVEAWYDVVHFFPDNGNRSRVVLTTRMSNVARDCSRSCFPMKPLDEHASWKLFCEKAFQQEDCPYPELEKVGKEIARLCRGLPLSTVVIGSLLLKSPRSLKFWEHVVHNIRSVPDSREKEESLDILSLSYNHLPPHLKPCFLYMGVFKEDSEIRVSKIINLWVAEGFLRAKSTNVIEEVAEGYLEELIDRNMILVSSRRHNGKIGSCGIHDLTRDLCFRFAEEQEFFHVSEGELQGTERRLVCSKRYGLLHNEGAQLARSILEGSEIAQPVNQKLLRVWDDGHLEIPTDLYRNVNLRYLACRSHLHYLPSSVSLIWNLQTLIISSSYKEFVAPIEIWNMRQLRHVKCSGIHLPHPSDGLFMMDNLQTLTKAVNLRVSDEVCKIIPTIKKLNIAYGNAWHGYDDCLIECLGNFDRLRKLESLKLSTRGSKVREVVRFPISLNKLSLRGCQLRWEDLSMIGLLPQLEVLDLGIHSIMDEGGWSPIDGQFLRLKVLNLNGFGLYYWDADKLHFPVLEKLRLSCLSELEEIPPGIGEIPTLELICVDRCVMTVAISAMRIKEDQVENQGNDSLQIQLRISSWKLKSFEERVKAEGLTINDILLEICRI